MTLEPNTKFDRYKLIRNLGKGGFSEVWLAEDTLADVQCAIKIFLPSVQMDEEGLDVFRDEYKIIHNLNHTNLLNYNHLGVYENYPYLEMPFYDGGSAEKLIGKCDEKTCWKFLHDVAAGLAHLHSQKPPIIHQDIKPDNILSNKGDYVITDFGISLNAQNDPKDGGVVKGTKPYMPPEKFSEGYSGPIMAGDIWALGASAYELLTGRLPFNEGGAAQKIDTPVPYPSGDFSDDLKMLVARCMSFHTWDRPTANEIEELAAAELERRPISGNVNRTTNADNVPPVSTTDRTVRKGVPGWLVALIVLVAVGGAVLAVMKLTKSKDDTRQPIIIQRQEMPTINAPEPAAATTTTPKPAARPAQSQPAQVQQQPQQQQQQPTTQQPQQGQPNSLQFDGEE